MNEPSKKKTIVWYSLILIGFACFNFLWSLLYKQGNDWDIDAFLYLGSRLLHGDLLYLHDFETKLPLVQYLFSMASYFGGIGAWRIIVFVFTALCGYFGSKIISYCLEGVGRLKIFSTHLSSWWLFAIYMALLYALPGSQSAQLEMPAAAAAYLSLSLLLLAERKITFQSTLLSLAGCFLAFASLIRPNYAFVFVAYVPYFIIRGHQLLRERINQTFYFCIGYILTVFICFIPYFFSYKRMRALYDGLYAIIRFPQGGTFGVLAGQAHDSGSRLLYVTLFLAFALFLLLISRKDGKLFGLAYFAIIGSAALEFSFMETHYYSHYLITFVAYLAPVIYANINHYYNNNNRLSVSRNVSYKVLIILLMILPVKHAYRGLREFILKPQNIDLNINDRDINHALLAYLRNEKAAGHPFLVADGPIYHMLLDEPRIGDGHPAMLMLVLEGYKLQPVSNIYLFSRAVQHRPCLSLQNSDKDIFVVTKHTEMAKLIARCFSHGDITLDKHPTGGLEKFDIYIRHDPGKQSKVLSSASNTY